MDISTVNKSDGDQKVIANKRRNRVGRGPGSGNGKTAGRGMNGAGSRAGTSMSPAFEGGQMPLARRIPKRGFNNKAFADVVESVSIRTVIAVFDGSTPVTPDALLTKGLIARKDSYVKLIGNDPLEKAYQFKVHAASKGATEAVQKAGGSIELLPKKKPVVKNKMGSKKAKKD